MKEQELRELNAWIAEHVMGWHKFEFRNDGTNKEMSCKTCNNPLGGRYKHYATMFHAPQVGYVPMFTTDRAAAFEVLEKCLETLSGLGYFQMDKTEEGFVIDFDFATEIPGLIAVGPTLPLTICQFAKHLFSKTEEGR